MALRHKSRMAYRDDDFYVASRMCFREYRQGKIELAKRMANLTFSVISKSHDKLLIGKTYWKSVVQPR